MHNLDLVATAVVHHKGESQKSKKKKREREREREKERGKSGHRDIAFDLRGDVPSAAQTAVTHILFDEMKG